MGSNGRSKPRGCRKERLEMEFERSTMFLIIGESASTPQANEILDVKPAKPIESISRDA